MPRILRTILILLGLCFAFTRESNAQPAAATSANTPPQDPWLTPIPDFSGGGEKYLQSFVNDLEPILKAHGIRLRISERYPLDTQIQTQNLGPTLKDVMESIAWTTRGAFRFDANVEEGQLTLHLWYLVPDPDQTRLGNFEFKGGTAKDLAEKIRSENLGWTNIYTPPAVADLPVPPFKVQRVSFSELCGIVSTITQGQCSISSTGTFLEVNTRNAAPTVSTIILPLRDLLKTYRIEDVEALVATALKMRENRLGETENPPDMSMHRETSTLIVVGGADQLKVVQDVIKALEEQGAPDSEKKSTPSGTPPKAAPSPQATPAS